MPPTATLYGVELKPFTAWPLTANMGVRVVAAGGAAVSRGNQDGDALCRSLLPRLLRNAFQRPCGAFASAEADAEHGRDIAVNSMFYGKNQAGLSSGVGGDDKIDGGIGRYGSGPFDIEIGLEEAPLGPSGLLTPSTPGSFPSMMTWGGFAGRPKRVRNWLTR